VRDGCARGHSHRHNVGWVDGGLVVGPRGTDRGSGGHGDEGGLGCGVDEEERRGEGRRYRIPRRSAVVGTTRVRVRVVVRVSVGVDERHRDGDLASEVRYARGEREW